MEVNNGKDLSYHARDMKANNEKDLEFQVVSMSYHARNMEGNNEKFCNFRLRLKKCERVE